MKKTILTILLTLSLAVSLAVPALAAPFPFTDVKPDSWYYTDVAKAYEMGLINGRDEKTFAPSDNMTYAEAVKLAACMHQRYAAGAVSLEAGSPWYAPYVDYARSQGILSRDYPWGQPATRADYVEIFSHALPDAAFPAMNSVANDSIPDVKTDHPNSQAIYKLYRAGIVIGSDTAGTFHPNDNIKRSEVSAILTRMMDPSARKSVTLPPPPPQPQPPTNSGGSVSLSLQYAAGGADNQYYVQEATVGAPWCGDLDNDGKNELLWASRSLFCLDPATGKTRWRVDSGCDRSGGGSVFGANALDLQVADLDGDGRREIVTAHNNYASNKTCLSVYDSTGAFRPGWPKIMDYTIRSMKTADLDGDGRAEILVGLGAGHAGWGENGAPTLYVFQGDGTIRRGWPQNCDYGLFANSITAADLDGDGMKEILLTYDGEHPRAFHADGTQVIATGGIYAGLGWNHLLLAENYDHEVVCTNFAREHNGTVWASGKTLLTPDRKDSYAFMGSAGGSAVADLDGNGSQEVIFTGMIVDGNYLMDGVTPYSQVAKYCTLFLLNADRTRYTNPARGFDWTQIPTDPAPLISVDYDFILNADMTPVVADVDGDGCKEILYAANDGGLHCWGLDKKEKGSWPCMVSTPADAEKLYATRPVCADVNRDGKPEVIFASYPQNGPVRTRGSLYVLDGSGQVLAQTPLPENYSEDSRSEGANGSKAQPWVGDLDGDGKIEIALTTLYSGMTVYEINS